MKKFAMITSLVFALLISSVTGLHAAEPVAPPVAHGPVPTKGQLDYYKEELAAFMHFGMNTFTGTEWGNGKESPSSFNPTALDAEQWVRILMK